jgi:DNA-binding transcriptional ArsR family regulator
LLEKKFYIDEPVTEWAFLTSHARALVCIARDPGVRLREIADVLGVTERRAFGIVTDLTDAGYVIKEKDGRRNRYRIQRHLPLPRPVDREPTVGELLGVLVDTGATEFAQPRNNEVDSSRPKKGTAARRTRTAKPRRSP